MSVCFLTLVVSESCCQSSWRALLLAEGGSLEGGQGWLASPVGTQPVAEEPVHEKFH